MQLGLQPRCAADTQLLLAADVAGQHRFRQDSC
jgi:hypothetical protein